MRPQRRKEGVKRAKKVLKAWDATNYCNSCGSHLESFKNGDRHAKAMIYTRKRCSCYMCGNPRKHWNDKTIQEKKADISFKEQLDRATQDVIMKCDNRKKCRWGKAKYDVTITEGDKISSISLCKECLNKAQKKALHFEMSVEYKNRK